MPRNGQDDGFLDAGGTRVLLGYAAPLVAASTAPPLLGAAPTVSSTPNPGQGVALTAGGTLPSSAAATGLRRLTSDPQSSLVGEFWYRTDLDKLSVKTATGVKRSASLT